jgi:type II secretory pathway pseudopilin PulG
MSLEADFPRPTSGDHERGGNVQRGVGWLGLLSVPAAIGAFVLASGMQNYLSHLNDQRAKRTVIAMRALGEAVEEYAVDHGRYPAPASSVVTGTSQGRGSNGWPSPIAWPARTCQAMALRPFLFPRYLEKFSGLDAWGRPILYATSEDGKAYTFVSTGRDGRHDGARSITPGPVRDLDRDLVYADGYLYTWFYN